MARLVDDLLSLSRIELNEHVAPTGRVALAPVIERSRAAWNCARPSAASASCRCFRRICRTSGGARRAGSGLSEPPRQRDQIRPTAQRDHGNRQSWPGTAAGTASPQCASPSPIRARASPASTASADRAVLSRRYGAFARTRRHRAWPRDRQASREPASRPARNHQQAGPGLDIHGVPARGRSAIVVIKPQRNGHRAALAPS